MFFLCHYFSKLVAEITTKCFINIVTEVIIRTTVTLDEYFRSVPVLKVFEP